MNIRSITEIIKETLKNYWGEDKGAFPWREPLAAAADADDPLFHELKKAVSPTHFLPSDMLDGAQSVICFFLPFTKEVSEGNRKERLASAGWARAYIETNRVIAKISKRLADELKANGHESATAPATHNFLPEKCISDWSHRHAAYIAGLGTFGINNMLITSSGCAGRFGSLITSGKIEPAKKLEKEYCLYKANGTCGICVKQCPTGALTFKDFDRFTCYEMLLENDRHHKMEEEADVCGKCVVGLPCSLKAPGI